MNQSRVVPEQFRGVPMTLEAIGRVEGMSKQRVAQVLLRALRKLYRASRHDPEVLALLRQVETMEAARRESEAA